MAENTSAAGKRAASSETWQAGSGMMAVLKGRLTWDTAFPPSSDSPMKAAKHALAV